MKFYLSTCLLLLMLCAYQETTIGQETSPMAKFLVKSDFALRQLNKNFCWFHPRAAAMPGFGQNGNPAVIMTIQKLLMADDFYSGMYFMRTNDLGKSWTGPVEIPELSWEYEVDSTIVSVTDVTPGWHNSTGKLIAIGIMVRYTKKGKQLLDKSRSHDAVYTVFDPKTEKWTPWKILAKVPEPNSKFYFVNPGNVQWLVKPDGNILLPIYFSGAGSGESSDQSVTVLECSFDGAEMAYVRHGNEMSVQGGRGLVEPSLTMFKNRYYLTLRNDFRAYVTTSNDGLNYLPIKEWTFNDGQELGSFNTQAHWLSHSKGLFLTYTRRDASNGHITRNRAPMFIAEVDPEKINVLRSTERILIPERGVMLGNFGAAPITKDESWVTDAEYIYGDKPNPRGADGTVWTSRVLWSKKNKLVKY